MTDEERKQLAEVVGAAVAEALQANRDPFQINGRILGLALAALMAVGVWMVSSLNDFSDRMLVMETLFTAATEDRFYRHEGEAMESRVNSRIDLMESRVRILEQEHDNE